MQRAAASWSGSSRRHPGDGFTGWRYLAHRPGPRLLVAVFGLFNVLFAMAGVLVQPLILSFGSPSTLGVLMFAGGSGTFIGNLVMSAWGGPRRRTNGVLGFMPLGGVFLALHSLRPSPLLIGVVAPLFLFTLPVVNGCTMTLLQSKTDPATLGRVLATARMVSRATMLLGYVTAGPMADLVFEPLLRPGGALAGVGEGRGIALVFLVVGVLMTLLAVAAYFQPRLRHLEDEIPDALPDTPAATPEPKQEPGAETGSRRRLTARQTTRGARMPLPLGPDGARRFLERHEAPAPHLDLLHAMAFRAAAAALRLGVFEVLAGGPLPATDVAAKLPADERGLIVLLDALVRFGYLEVDGNRYANAPAADTWLHHDRPGSYATRLRFWEALLGDLWGDLESSVRDGRPARDFYAWLEQHPDRAHEFQQMLAGLADEIVATVALGADATKLLDLGGGHGRYSVAFCRRYPRLHATILDLPAAIAAGRDLVAATRLAGRVTLRPGDLPTTDLGRGYDTALLFNVLHGSGAEDNRALLRRAAGALRPGGLLILLEPLPDLPERAGAEDAAFLAGFSLNLFHTQGGQVYEFDDYARWLTETGFSAPDRHRLQSSPTDNLLTATRLP